MDLTAKWYHDPSSIYAPNGVEKAHGMDPTTAAATTNRLCNFYTMSSSGNPFLDAFPEPDPLCKLNLKETSEFVSSLPTIGRTSTDSKGLLDVPLSRRRDGVNSVTQQRRTEAQAPCTPGRPIFSFSSASNFNVLPRKSFPSKWDDAEKWVMGLGGSCHSSPAHPMKTTLDPSKWNKQLAEDVFSEKSRVTEEVMVSKVVPNFHGSLSSDHGDNSDLDEAFNVVSATAAEVLLKDKFTDEVRTILPKFRCSEPSSKEGFLFRNPITGSMKDKATEVIHHRDIGTEMTPLGSSTNSRCHTPFKSSSPARHNTPASRSGPLGPENCHSDSGGGPAIDISQLNECHHLAKLQLGGSRKNYDSITSNWSSREEEEEEVSKSLRHFENASGGGCLQKSGSESRAAAAAAWEEEEKLKCCLRYQREEAKIQAWVNLEGAKAEAQSRKLEVKIQKMRSKLEEKLMRRMAVVHRKAEEWRAEARQQHTDQVEKATEQAKRMATRQSSLYVSGYYGSCGCFPCSNP